MNLIIFLKDLLSFSNEDFDPIDWINNCFDDNQRDTKIETIASDLVFNLQLLIQEVNISLDESARKMINNLPKVVEEIEMIEKDSLVLKEQMVSNKQKLDKMSSDSSKSVETLKNIDLIKERMETFLNTICSANN